MTSPITYFKNLDGLRFVCFFIIFLYHSFHSDFEHITNSDTYYFVTREVMGNGNLGVNFFFVLSGFLITFLLIQERTISRSINLKSFWMRRILRIWPVYFICVAFGFIAFPILKSWLGQIPAETANPYMYISFLSNFDIIINDLPDSSVLGVLWSISIEEQFYLIWPILLLIVPLRSYWVVFSGVVLSSIIYRLNFDSYLEHEYHTLSCISDMAIGAWGAWLVSQNNQVIAFFKSSNKIFSASLWILFALFFLFCDETIRTLYPLRIAERLIFGIIALLVILDLNYNPRTIIPFYKYKTISYFGKISYGLYAYHFIAILVVTTLTRILGINTAIWEVLILETLLALMLTILIAHVSFNFIETPFLNLKKKFTPNQINIK